MRFQGQHVALSLTHATGPLLSESQSACYSEHLPLNGNGVFVSLMVSSKLSMSMADVRRATLARCLRVNHFSRFPQPLKEPSCSLKIPSRAR